jgi:hypothetical protein
VDYPVAIAGCSRRLFAIQCLLKMFAKHVSVSPKAGVNSRRIKAKTLCKMQGNKHENQIDAPLPPNRPCWLAVEMGDPFCKPTAG